MRTIHEPADKLRFSVQDRFAEGKGLREKVPRSVHSEWTCPKNRPEPAELLKEADRGRLPGLLPIRYGRMRESPFAFFRGSAALMAADLAATPSTGIRVQACGDCHVANFGGFGTPERQLVFDINDFDETLPAPWEWDVKRLAASIVLAMRQAGFSENQCRNAVRTAAGSYWKRMRQYARMSALDVWYSHLSADLLVRNALTPEAGKRWQELEAKAALDNPGHEFPKIATEQQGRPRILDHPPLIYHSRETAVVGKSVRRMFHQYRATLPEERRIVLDRYHLVDIARKVVGVTSVGTRCAVALLMAGPRDPLFLQFKEARASVLERYAGKSRYPNHGERVVTGQRMLQSASDIFLGWTEDGEGHNFYFRQLRDMRMKIDIAGMSGQDWVEYAGLCGWVLARAHARTGDPAAIAGYLGKSEAFDEAIGKFAAAYANQTESDHALFLKAIRAGRIRARTAAPPGKPAAAAGKRSAGAPKK
ncbi:MAG TPA: DUF2252 domain-containing protein [Terriglobia bacterium]|nr:DUF2252 domain-containing protein [Terriglobia bacterium]